MKQTKFMMTRDMLAKPEGVSVAELAKRFGCKLKTAHGYIARWRGVRADVIREKNERSETVYRFGPSNPELWAARGDEDLSVRCLNVLHNNEIELDKTNTMSDAELLALYDFGPALLKEIRNHWALLKEKPSS
jgi:DNA-directed RNA polymerase alpha subunit